MIAMTNRGPSTAVPASPAAQLPANMSDASAAPRSRPSFFGKGSRQGSSSTGRGGRRSAGPGQTRNAIERVLGREQPRNRRQSFLLKQEKKKFLEDQFRFSVFLKFFLYHITFPFCLPVVLAVDGLTLAINMDFWFVSSFGGFFNQWIMFFVLAVPTVVMVLTAEVNRNITMIMCGLAWVVYVWRQFIIGVKYAYFSKDQLKQLQTVRLQARERNMRTLRAWSLMPKALYGRQVRLAALRLDLPEATEQLLYLEEEQVPILAAMFPLDESLLPGPGDNTISIFNLIIMLYRKAHAELPAATFTRDVLYSSATPLVFFLWWLAVMERDSVPVSWLTFVLLVLFAFAYTFFCIVVFTFLRVAELDYRRRAFALNTLNSLVEVVVRVLPDGTTRQAAVIPMHYAHNIERVLTLRRLVKEFGYSFYRRIQVVMATNTIVVVIIVVLSLIFTFITNQLLGPMIVACILNLAFLTEALLKMIIAGGDANDSVVSLLRALRYVQIQMFGSLEDLDYPKLAEMKTQALSVLAKKHDVPRELTTNPLAVLTKSTSISLAHVTERQANYLRKPGVRMEVEVCANNINSAARHLEDEDLYTPITLFGLTAGPGLLKFVATLAFSAVSVGLRNIIEQGVELLRAQSALG